MSDKLNELREKRFRILNRLYEVSSGNQFVHVNVWDLGKEIGISHEDTNVITQYLEGEGLLEGVAMGGGIAITHYGVKQVEEALSAPTRPTRYFPPVLNIINIHRMEGSQIQQGNIDSNQIMQPTQAGLESLDRFLVLLAARLPELNLSTDAGVDMTADIQTLEAQRSSTHPKGTIIRESLRSIRTVVEGAAGSVAATEILAHLPAVLSLFK
jgi:hypothetical protein